MNDPLDRSRSCPSDRSNSKRRPKMIKVPPTTIDVLLGLAIILLSFNQLASATVKHVEEERIVNSKNSELIITTKHGKVRGRRHFLPSFSRMVDTYLGIPFAKPPLGHLRYMPPQPPDRWGNIFNASDHPNACFQIPDTFFGTDFQGTNMWNPVTDVSEDCLYLNVYVPRPSPASSTSTPQSGSRTGNRPHKMAVMVWIYGGGFYSGTISLDLYDGRYLAVVSNTIVVSINYRLGALGFFTMNDPQAPPNVGLYDQLMGLEWVQHNIAQFGGDPENVTLFGESAGAVSVSLHLLSPLSHDKFHRAILQSGTANMPWAVISMEDAHTRSKMLATAVGCDNGTSDKLSIVECMKQKSADVIVSEQWITRGILQFPFLPVVDGVFLPDFPDKLMERREFKKCPLLIGSNGNEGSYFLIYELTPLINLTSKSMDQKQFKKSLMQLFFYYPQFPYRMPPRGIDAVSFQYTNWANVNDVDQNIYALDMAIADSQFLCPLNQFAYAYSSAGQDVYAYYFTQRIESHYWPKWLGVLHADEIFLMFSDASKWKLNYTAKERELSSKMIFYWSNFAKHGNPNRNPGQEDLNHWPLHSVDGLEYLELNTKYLEADQWQAVGRGPRMEKCAFWTEYLPKLLSEAHPQLSGKQQPISGSSSAATGYSPSDTPSQFWFLVVFLLLQTHYATTSIFR